MNFIEEQDGAAIMLAEALTSTLDDLAHIFNACGHSRQLFKMAFGGTRHCQRERGLAGARRSPEDGRAQPVLLDESAQWPSRSHKMRLPHNLVERARSQTCCERSLLAQSIGGCRAEQIVAHNELSTNW